MNNKLKKNPGESIRQRLKNLAIEKNRPFDEILRYYAMERFLYRLSISSYAHKFFLKGGLLLKVLDPKDHRATMDIDFLARTSNKIDNLRHIISEISAIEAPDDAISFDTQKLILRETQTGGDYQGLSASFIAQLFTTKIPILIDIGFNDIIVPKPTKVNYPTLLSMPALQLMGYTLETVIAEKLESIVKRGLVNTRMKDFYDLWTLFQTPGLNLESTTSAIQQVFANRKSKIEYPIAFTKAFYETPETIQRWENFLSAMGKTTISLKTVISEISLVIRPLL